MSQLEKEDDAKTRGAAKTQRVLDRVTKPIKSPRVLDLGICNDWDELMGFVLITNGTDGIKRCNQLSCTVLSCEYHLISESGDPFLEMFRDVLECRLVVAADNATLELNR